MSNLACSTQYGAHNRSEWLEHPISPSTRDSTKPLHILSDTNTICKQRRCKMQISRQRSREEHITSTQQLLPAPTGVAVGRGHECDPHGEL